MLQKLNGMDTRKYGDTLSPAEKADLKIKCIGMARSSLNSTEVLAQAKSFYEWLLNDDVDSVLAADMDKVVKDTLTPDS